MSKGSPFATLNELAVTDGKRKGARGAGKRPSPRILNAGGTAMRMLGVLVVIGGFWPFIWAVFELVIVLQGGPSEIKWQVSDGFITFRFGGWAAIGFGVLWAVATWWLALIVFAFGHALYVLRDIASKQSIA